MRTHTVSKLVCLSLGAIASLCAQDLTIVNARIIGPNGTVIERGSIVVRAGKIVSVAPGAPAGKSGRTIDAKGMTAMPGFIDGIGTSIPDPMRSSRCRRCSKPVTPPCCRAAARRKETSRSAITSTRASSMDRASSRPGQPAAEQQHSGNGSRRGPKDGWHGNQVYRRNRPDSYSRGRAKRNWKFSGPLSTKRRRWA
jgi:hypothetical protein